MLTKIISGGQTGADRIGLEAARVNGFLTGGMAPKNYYTENRPDYSLRDIFGLIECSEMGYSFRTHYNVINSDATCLFGDMLSSGSKATIKYCIKENKPYKCNPTFEELVEWVGQLNISTLNIAGNRGSKLSDIQSKAIFDILDKALKLLKA